MQPEKVEARTVAAVSSLEEIELTTNGKLIAEFEICKSKLERLTDDLAAIADWKDELQRKIHLAQLKFELVDCLDTAERESLEAEVKSFKEVCARLGETMAVEENKSERAAA